MKVNIVICPVCCKNCSRTLNVYVLRARPGQKWTKLNGTGESINGHAIRSQNFTQSYLRWQWHAPGSGSAAEARPPAPEARRWSRCSDAQIQIAEFRLWSPPNWRDAVDSSFCEWKAPQQAPMCTGNVNVSLYDPDSELDHRQRNNSPNTVFELCTSTTLD